MASTQGHVPTGYDTVGSTIAYVIGAIGGLLVLTPALADDAPALLGGGAAGWLGSTVVLGSLGLGGLVIVIWLLFLAAKAGG